MSLLGIGNDSGGCNDGGLHGAICNSVNAGVPYTVAAGNNRDNAANYVPAAYDEVITVSALADFDGQPGGFGSPTCRADQDDTFADFSNYGADVDIAAPGVCIASTYRSGGYATLSGTSMAAPHVAGAAALFKATNLGASPLAVKDALISAVESGPITGDPDGSAEDILNIGDGANETNQAPNAVADSATTDEDVVVTIDVLANDSDPENDELTVSAVTQGADGAVAVNADSSVTYTPDADFNGSDQFTYTVSDGNGGADSATVTVTVNPVNGPPVAADDAAGTTATVAVAIDVLANDADPDGDPLTVSAVTQGAGGSVVINGDNTVTYTPNAGFAGADAFTYTVDDGNGGAATATVSVTVEAATANTPPVATDDAATTNEGTAVVIPILVNDGDADGDPLTVTNMGQPTAGSVALNADGTVTYTPFAGFSGSDLFTYTVNDGAVDSNVATVTVTVSALVVGPAAPSNLAAYVNGPLVYLVWADNATTETGYRVYRRVAGGAWGVVADGLPADYPTYQDMTPGPGSYEYYVVAFNAAGESGASNIASAQVT